MASNPPFSFQPVATLLLIHEPRRLSTFVEFNADLVHFGPHKKKGGPLKTPKFPGAGPQTLPQSWPARAAPRTQDGPIKYIALWSSSSHQHDHCSTATLEKGILHSKSMVNETTNWFGVYNKLQFMSHSWSFRPPLLDDWAPSLLPIPHHPLVGLDLKGGHY